MRNAEGRTKSCVWYEPGITTDPDAKVYLPNQESIVFDLPDGKIRVHIRDDLLDVNGDDRIFIYPSASNAALIQCEGRRVRRAPRS